MATDSQEPRQDYAADDLWRRQVDHKIDTILNQNRTMLNIIQGMPSGTKSQKAGILGMVENHDERIEKLERFKNNMTWLVRGMLVPTSYGIFEFFRQILFKH